MHVLSLKYRLFPSKSQCRELADTLETCRNVYNSLLNWHEHDYAVFGKAPSRYEQQKVFPSWKKQFPDVAAVHSQVLQNVANRVETTWRGFFRRVKECQSPGFPRIKGAGYDSFTYPQTGFDVGESHVSLFLSGKRETIKANLHRALVGKIKTCTVLRRNDKWFVSFTVECEDAPLPASEDAVGIDLGVTSFAALSNGEFVDNPRFFRRDENALAKAQRKLAKQPRGSRKRRNARKVVSRIHERIRNRRHDFVHQTSRRIVNRFGVVAIEDLSVANMSRAPHPVVDVESGEFMPNGAGAKAGINKSILDAAWSQFRDALTYKAESAGRILVAVNPANTSQDCHNCGHRARKTLRERWHLCPICGASLDRDTNAAINILSRAIESRRLAAVEAP
jgi:putative transposase